MRRTEYQLSRQFVEQGGLPLRQDVHVPHIAEQARPPDQLLLQMPGLGRVEQLGEHPDRAAQSAYRDPGRVDDVLAGAQLVLGVNDHRALLGDTHRRHRERWQACCSC